MAGGVSVDTLGGDREDRPRWMKVTRRDARCRGIQWRAVVGARRGVRQWQRASRAHGTNRGVDGLNGCVTLLWVPRRASFDLRTDLGRPVND